jgi:hypothetical protein
MANPHLNGLRADRLHGRTTDKVTIPAGKSLVVDTISEATAANGVVIDGTTIKDGGVTMTSSGALSANTISEVTAANGVVIDGTTVKDGGVTTSSTGLLALGSVATLAAAGSAQGDAAAITKQVTFVTASDGTKGVVLPAVTAGAIYIVYDTVATNGVKVYPASGDDINDGSADAAVHIEGKTMAIFVGLDTSTWAAMYTANS